MPALVENQPIMWFDGLVDLSLVGYIAVTLVLTHITIASVTIFLHRCQAHRALSLHPLASHFFRFWLWLTTGMVTQEWVAVHRKHHARCETDADPHSPQTKGIWRVLFLGAWLYREETQKQETLDVYGRFTPNDWLEKHVYGRYRFLGIELMFVIDVLLFGAAGAFIFLVQMLWIPFWAAGVINGVGHYLGYRNFETQDASRNIVPLGILVGGEEFHNNHHAYAYSAKLSNHWWEFDIGWFYIRMLERLGLAKVKRVLPRTSFAPGKTVIDSETLRAVIGNRFHVLKLYGRGVIAPVLLGHAEDGFSRRLLARIRRLMIREDATAPHEDLPARRALELALERSATLRTVYQSMQQLKALWGHSIKTDSDRLNRLQAWCTEAEASGIRALRDFARQLQAYTAQAA